MSQEHLTGLALMHVHIDIPVSVEEIITRLQLNILVAYSSESSGGEAPATYLSFRGE